MDYIHTAKSVDPVWNSHNSPFSHWIPLLTLILLQNELYQFALVVGKIMEAGKGLIGTDPVAKAAAKEFAREYIDTEHRRVATEIHQALIAVAKSVKLAARNSTLKDILAAQNKTNHCLADISESLATLVKQVAAVSWNAAPLLLRSPHRRDRPGGLLSADIPPPPAGPEPQAHRRARAGRRRDDPGFRRCCRSGRGGAWQ